MEITIKQKGIDKPVELHANKAEELLDVVEKLGSYIGDELFEMIKNGKGGNGDHLTLCNKLGEQFATKSRDLKASMESGNIPFVQTHSIESILRKAIL